MVQLKSFKYLVDQPQQQPQTTPTISTSSSSSSLSSTISGGGGGNLTANDADSSSVKLQNNSSSESITTTLSSNEEYQVANHDIIEEEDEEEEEGDYFESKQATTINIEQSNGKRIDEIEKAPKVNVNVNKQTESVRIPLSPRLRDQIKARHPLESPKLASLRNNNPDSVSQYSFIQGNNQNQGNQFEIRWHNINLYAGKSSLPRVITENRLYKLFARRGGRDEEEVEDEEGKQEQQQQHQVGASKINGKLFCHTPTLNNKFVRVSEALELNQQIKKVNSTGFEQAQPLPAHWNADSSRPILRNVSGSVVSGQLTAILGPSGVGKTTLLNSLTGRNTLEGTGKVQLLGGASSKRMSVVTVPQADVLPAKLTALEDLRFTSRIKNPQPKFNHKKNIDKIVQHLQMEKFLNTRIDKLSGGEARRLSIGRELLSSPDIMILDEPTSGLDANTCKKIITALRDIVVHSDNILDRPMAIIVTIHQPQQEVFNLFHRCYVMAVGGRAIYEGPPTSLLPTFIEQSSLSKVCPVDQLNENPAIVAIELASGEYGAHIIDELAFHHENQMYEDYAASSLANDETSFYTNSPYSTPRVPRTPKTPLNATPRFGGGGANQRRRLKSIDADRLGRQTTPILAAKRAAHLYQSDHLSTVTSVSYSSSYDAELPEPESHLKVDKRLRRSVVMKGDFLVHTMTLMKRCWLLTTRDMFLMAIRILGFLLVAGGMVQIFSHALDPSENQCPLYETEVSDVISFMESTRSRLLGMGQQLKQASSTHLFFFHLVLCITMVTSALAGLVFPMQMRMFMREYKNGWYSPASFITSITLAELPVDIIGPLLTLLLTYPLCNQPSSEYYWREIGYIIVLIISSIICKSQAQIVGAFLMDSVENSVFISCVMVTPPALLSGIAVRVSAMSWPLQILSFGSFLRYAFECLFVMRYGYGICPCDSELVHGYPTRTSAEAIPAQLDRLARGFLELNNNNNEEANLQQNVNASLTIAQDSNGENLFVRFLRLISASSNQFIPVPEDLGDCSKYRSLYLIDMGIKDKILPTWIAIMILMFIASRIITYFVVKTVIKLRRRTD